MVGYRVPENAEHEALSALFLGPKAENFDMLKELFNIVLDGQKQARKEYHPEDKVSFQIIVAELSIQVLQDFISTSIIESRPYGQMKESMRKSLIDMVELLNRYSIPFFSPRYSAHMTTDVTIPGILGYMSTMIFNPNNVAFEASPVTTLIEVDVGEQLSKMLGYNTIESSGALTAWGHITCDGTVANLEAIW